MTTALQHTKEQGGVSLFVVIFATLLLSVITVGFVQLMLSDQRQAADSDLSQSAYDSAQAGVEDAKRVLLRQMSCGDSTSTECARIANAISSQSCDTISRALGGGATADETDIVSGSNDAQLDQAYTCVKITPNTSDYLVPNIRADDSVMVPLVGESSFNRVRLSWFTSTDAGGVSTVTLPAVGSTPSLPAAELWGATRPSLLRAQLMQTGPNFTLDDFDGNNARTLFLYPSATGATSVNYGLDARRSASATRLHEVTCQPNFTTAQYACSVELVLTNPVGGGVGNRANAFLRLSPLYNQASVRVQLLNGSTVVNFNGVQPAIDSTGRAGDLFRRVETRVELNAEALYPRASVDVEGNLCKNFSVTNQASDYSNVCTP